MSAQDFSGHGERYRFFQAGLPQEKLNPPWEEASLRVLFVRLSPFSDAVRSTAHTVLFSWMRKVLGPAALGDFAFLPDARERRRLEESGAAWMCGVQTGKAAPDFDVICVSCSVLQELPNLPLALLRARVPLRASVRRQNGSFPPVLLGGSSAALSRGLFFPDGDSFADGVYIGEIEPYAQVFFETLLKTRKMGAAAVVRELARSIPAFYPVDFGSTAWQGILFPEAARAFSPWEQLAPVVFDSPAADTVRLEISRGCPAFCTFCHEAWERRPYREISAAAALAAARRLAIETGASTVEVSAFNFNTHREMAALADGLHRIFDRVNFMSQRADVLARHAWMLPLELAAEKRSFTVGVEGISRRMRQFYAKGLEESDLLAVLESLVAARVREIKLFFILAGIENASDLEEFNALCDDMNAIFRRHCRGRQGPRTVFSAGFLVRMPQTPLQFDMPELNRAHMEFLARRMEKSATGYGFEFRMAVSWDEYVLGQALAFASPRTASLLEESARQGWVCDNGVPKELARRLAEDLRELSREPSFAGRMVSEPGTAQKRAWEEANFREIAPCCKTLATVGQKAFCHGCSACRDAAEREFLIGHVIAVPPASAALSLAEWVRNKRRIRPLYIRATLPEPLAGLAREALEAHLQAAVLQQMPDLAGKLFRIREELWNHPAWEERVGAGWCGATVLGLHGVSEAIPALAMQDAQAACAALESFLGAPVFLLPSFDATRVISVRASVAWEAASERQALQTVRNWLSALRISFTEKRIEEQDKKNATAREFVISPHDLRKRVLRRVIFRMTPLSGESGRADVLAEGGEKWNPAPLLSGIASSRLARIDAFETADRVTTNQP